MSQRESEDQLEWIGSIFELVCQTSAEKINIQKYAIKWLHIFVVRAIMQPRSCI